MDARRRVGGFGDVHGGDVRRPRVSGFSHGDVCRRVSGFAQGDVCRRVSGFARTGHGSAGVHGDVCRRVSGFAQTGHGSAAHGIELCTVGSMVFSRTGHSGNCGDVRR